MRVAEGDQVSCVYCAGVVTIEEVVAGDPEDANTAAVFCEGTCDSCERRVDYDYDPVEDPPLPGSRTGPGVSE